eukprot:COSAG05_NODE_11953_length_489_cov_0.797436_2_plen_103_part_01
MLAAGLRQHHQCPQLLAELDPLGEPTEWKSLSKSQEFNQWGYAKAHNKFGEFVETFTELVCAAQEFVREFHGGERSAASLRDVARCIKVYRWFGEHFHKTQKA